MTLSLSKSKLIALRQCPRRLWLEVHRKDLRQDDPGAMARMAAGNELGALARQLYDPAGEGALVDIELLGIERALTLSKELIASPVKPVFEAGFAAGGALAFADVLLPVAGTRSGWRMVEVKSSTEVKDYHQDDAAIQAFVATESGLDLQGLHLAVVDSDWVYNGDGDYQGLLVEHDLTEASVGRADEVREWIREGSAIVAQATEPQRMTGAHCTTPFACGFHAHCSAQEPKAQYPVAWLPKRGSKALKDHLSKPEVRDMRDVPDDLLNDTQLRVKHHTINNTRQLEIEELRAKLQPLGFPAYFMDFETVSFVVPRWAGTRPYQQIPFQFSVQVMQEDGALTNAAFLDLSGDDPRRSFAQSLIEACGSEGPVFVYNAAFERARINELAEQFQELAPRLLAINQRVFDLLPLARSHAYAPSQEGSWSIKAVLPAFVPELSYDALEGIRDGGGASSGYLEAIANETTAERREEIRRQLLAYCNLDTVAMVRLWGVFAGRGDAGSSAAT